MRARPSGVALIAAAGLLVGCQENAARPDIPAPEPPHATATPFLSTVQPQTPSGAPHDNSARDRYREPSRQAQAAPTAKPESASKPRLSAKSAAYDRQGPAYSLLQAPLSAMGDFPTDTLGGIDWVAALQRGLIEPRADVSGLGTMRRRDDAIIMRNTLDMPWVRFPHAEHTEWLDCSNCHPHPFAEKVDSTEITMDSIMRGRHCGLCHDRVAFSIFACERCHSVTHPGSPAPWW